MNEIPRLWIAVVSLATAVAVTGALHLAQTKASLAKAAAPPKTPVAGVKVHIDPVTRRIIPPPPRAAADPGMKAQFPSSHEGLTEERGATPAGGFKVDARGHFRSAVTLQMSPDGKPVATCVDQAVGSTHKE